MLFLRPELIFETELCVQQWWYVLAVGCPSLQSNSDWFQLWTGTIHWHFLSRQQCLICTEPTITMSEPASLCYRLQHPGVVVVPWSLCQLLLRGLSHSTHPLHSERCCSSSRYLFVRGLGVGGVWGGGGSKNTNSSVHNRSVIFSNCLIEWSSFTEPSHITPPTPTPPGSPVIRIVWTPLI